uniref:Uncharacterized protein n=1 Tax=Anthurium amnicola TaxID=1678845 RepID=A0A1D1XNJ7_9ARAE
MDGSLYCCVHTDTLYILQHFFLVIIYIGTLCSHSKVYQYSLEMSIKKRQSVVISRFIYHNSCANENSFMPFSSLEECQLGVGPFISVIIFHFYPLLKFLRTLILN